MFARYAHGPPGVRSSAVIFKRILSVVTVADEVKKNVMTQIWGRPLIVKNKGRKRSREERSSAILLCFQPGTHRGSVNLSEAGYNLLHCDAWGDHGALSPVVLVID